MASTPSPQASGRHKRSVKNYLLDPAFQLKYTGYLVAVALALSVALGSVLWQTSREVLAQNRAAVVQGRETVKRGKELVKTSQDLSKVVQMSIAEKYADDPDTAALFNKGADQKARELAAEQQRLEAENASLDLQAARIEQQQTTILITLASALSLLVLFIGLAGIVVTHKIAGPIFKMKRQLNDLGQGSLKMPSKLRKGDELTDLFAAFEGAISTLRSRQEHGIQKVDEAIASLEAAGISGDKLRTLRALRDDMQSQL
ncbi:MAG: HAMP domain-containing protein [Myxococcales bacterium]|nr:MAG: HAMP domain-containing protein [Myxococcales bacterium]